MYIQTVIKTVKYILTCIQRERGRDEGDTHMYIETVKYILTCIQREVEYVGGTDRYIQTVVYGYRDG